MEARSSSNILVIFIYLRRVEHEVVDSPTAGVDPSVLHSLDDRLEGDAEVHHDVDGSLRLERLGLSHGPEECRESRVSILQISPWKAVEQPGLRPELLQLGGDEADHDLVRHEVALVDVGLGGQAQLGALPHLGPQEVSATDVEETEVPDDPVTGRGRQC